MTVDDSLRIFTGTKRHGAIKIAEQPNDAGVCVDSHLKITPSMAHMWLKWDSTWLDSHDFILTNSYYCSLILF